MLWIKHLNIKNELTDKVFRSFGILKYAHTLSLVELFNLSSALRIGIECGILDGIKIETLNRMILLCLPVHMELFYKKDI